MSIMSFAHDELIPAEFEDCDIDADGEEPENRDKKILAVLPEYGICQLVDKVTYRMRDIREFWIDGNADSFKANIINWVWSRGEQQV